MVSKPLLRFGFVGSFSTLIDFGLYFLCIGQGVSPPIAKAAGYCLGLCSSFIGNTLWSFEQDKKQLISALVIFKFGLVYGVSLLANVAVNELARHIVGPFSVLFALAVSIVITFMGLKLFVYKQPVRDMT